MRPLEALLKMVFLCVIVAAPTFAQRITQAIDERDLVVLGRQYAVRSHFR